jgi:hypothetical protein
MSEQRIGGGIEPLGDLRSFTWMAVVLLILLGVVPGCKPGTSISAKEKPARVEKIEGTELSRITLTEKAAQRIGLQTTRVKVEQVLRTRKVGGEVKVVNVTSNSSAARVQVSLSRGELNRVNRSQPARVSALEDDREDQDNPTAELAGVEDGDNDADDVALNYAVKGAKGLSTGQRVFIELPLSTMMKRSVLPFSAVVYDLNGETWVYTNPQPLTFVRARVAVDYIDDEMAVLSAGPPEGTTVVTNGVAQLFGTEFGLGK